MIKTLPLSKFAFYPKKRVSTSSLTLDNYITTDNMFQNKGGVCTAENLPPKQCNAIAYKPGDTLVANIRPYLKKIWRADKTGGCSSDVLVFRPKEGVNPDFLYYGLFSDGFFRHLMQGKTGTKMPRGDKDHAMDFVLSDFLPDTQQHIASVLSALDSKIELNNRINAELEQMARTLYDYWFVQFDFPDENGRPYKSSGGKMVYNKTLKRKIPEGWEDGTLEDIADITMGQSPVGSSYNEAGNGSVFFQGSTDFGVLCPIIRQYTTKPKRLAKVGDILLSVRAPVGTLNIANVDCCIGRGLAALRSKQKQDAYFANVMLGFKQVFDRRNREGTTYGSIGKNDLHSLKTIMPPDSLLQVFEGAFARAHQVRLMNHRQNLELAAIRDWLLPMLMNGQVSVTR